VAYNYCDSFAKKVEIEANRERMALAASSTMTTTAATAPSPTVGHSIGNQMGTLQQPDAETIVVATVDTASSSFEGGNQITTPTLTASNLLDSDDLLRFQQPLSQLSMQSEREAQEQVSSLFSMEENEDVVMQYVQEEEEEEQVSSSSSEAPAPASTSTSASATTTLGLNTTPTVSTTTTSTTAFVSRPPPCIIAKPTIFSTGLLSSTTTTIDTPAVTTTTTTATTTTTVLPPVQETSSSSSLLYSPLSPNTFAIEPVCRRLSISEKTMAGIYEVCFFFIA
jgi:hypothetical protein